MAMNVQSPTTVTVLPYIAPRKTRKPEARRFCVKWLEGTTVHFRWYCRDADAVNFLNSLVEQGIPARIVMK